MKKALTVLTLVLLLSVFGFTQNLATVINALGARESTLTIFKQYAVTDDLTVPDNITLEFLQGGSLNISDTKTLTINGRVEAGLYTIFEWAGTGKVVFGVGSVREGCPQWWGALANGVADDTAAIQAAIDSLVGCLYMPTGVYLISPVAGVLAVTITVSNEIKIFGDGIGKTIIKVKDAAGPYWALLGGSLTLHDFEISGITFDHNMPNNPHLADPDLNYTTDSEVTILLDGGINIKVYDCEVVRACSVNNISVKKANCGNVWIERNLFREIGEDPGDFEHDSSVVYTHAVLGNVHIKDNTFEAAGINQEGTRCAIEIHGSEVEIIGNIINDFKVGGTITGITYEDSKNIIIADNTVKGAARGFSFWSKQYDIHTTGYGFDGLLVTGNIIDIEHIDSYPGEAMGGIHFYYGVGDELSSKNITIENNIIQTVLDSTSGVQRNTNIAIGWHSIDPYEVSLENTVIRNNTVINWPMSAILFGCYLKNVKIEDNHLINCGSTQTSPPQQYRTPISIISKSIEGLTIKDNYLCDTDDTTRIAYYIYLGQADGYVHSDILIKDNFFITPGSGVVNQIYLTNQGGMAKPLMINPIDDFVPTTLVNQKYALGSRVIDSKNNKLYRIREDQYTWASNSPWDVSLGTPIELTIDAGVITVTKSYHTVDGEGDANDNLDTINGFVDGIILILQAEDDAVTITIRDNSVGGGNIETEGDAAIVLDDVEDKAYLFYDATNSTWCEISRFTG